MTKIEKAQTRRMKWILFYVVVSIFVVIVALTIAKVWFDFGSPSPAERSVLFKVFIGEVGLTVLALFKVLFNLKKKPVEIEEETPVLKVNGKYQYKVACSDNKTTFLGECLVKQDGRELTFNGEQKKECVGTRKKSVSYQWFSNWAEMCMDNMVRLDYSIANGNGGQRGYAVLAVGRRYSSTKKSSKGRKNSKTRRSYKTMTGELYLLGQPHIFGTIKLRRV